LRPAPNKQWNREIAKKRWTALCGCFCFVFVFIFVLFLFLLPNDAQVQIVQRRSAFGQQRQ
jgi:hypothetical protein